MQKPCDSYICELSNQLNNSTGCRLKQTQQDGSVREWLD